jgi:hypothetical protein
MASSHLCRYCPPSRISQRLILLSRRRVAHIAVDRSSRETNSLGNSGMMFNVVDSPAGVVPVTRVDAAKDALPEGYWALSPGKMGSQILTKACEGLYDPVKMAGLPVGVQVCARIHRLRDDLTIRVPGCWEEMGGREGARHDARSGRSATPERPRAVGLTRGTRFGKNWGLV